MWGTEVRTHAFRQQPITSSQPSPSPSSSSILFVIINAKNNTSDWKSTFSTRPQNNRLQLVKSVWMQCFCILSEDLTQFHQSVWQSHHHIGIWYLCILHVMTSQTPQPTPCLLHWPLPVNFNGNGIPGAHFTIIVDGMDSSSGFYDEITRL